MDCDVVVAVSSFVFVVEAESVKEFVHDGSVSSDARIRERDALRSANHSDVRGTPASTVTSRMHHMCIIGIVTSDAPSAIFDVHVVVRSVAFVIDAREEDALLTVDRRRIDKITNSFLDRRNLLKSCNVGAKASRILYISQ